MTFRYFLILAQNDLNIYHLAPKVTMQNMLVLTKTSAKLFKQYDTPTSPDSHQGPPNPIRQCHEHQCNVFCKFTTWRVNFSSVINPRSNRDMSRTSWAGARAVAARGGDSVEIARRIAHGDQVQ